MALTGLNSEMMKRLRPMPITPIQAPRGVMPKDDPSPLKRFGKVAMDEGANTLATGAVNLGKKYGAPLMKKGWAAMTGPSQAALDAGVTTGAEMLGSMATTAGKGAGMMGSLGSMGTAAMASPAAPIIGGLLAMKMLGFFNKGGHVGPLYADQGATVKGADTSTKVLESIKDSIQAKKEAKNSPYLLPSFKAIDKEISKVEYKSAGGETYKLSYGGGPLSKGA